MNHLLRIVYIDSKYIRYLSKFDNRVMYNKGQRRPYLGVLFEVKGHQFYAPLTHPRTKFLTMKNDVDFIKIQGGELGAINLNNMIPVHKSAVKIIKTSEIENIKYRLLLINQMEYFDKHELDIVNRANKLYISYKKKTLRESVVKRCCNFIYLQSKVKKYDPNFVRGRQQKKQNNQGEQ